MGRESITEGYTYRYPHPAVTADCVVFCRQGAERRVLLIERGQEPCKGMWAFPGGFMNIDETAEACALRELEEETGLRVAPETLIQVGAFSDVRRDPRERVVTIAYCAEVEHALVEGRDDATRAEWWPLRALPPLAFDHDKILQRALVRLRQEAQG